MENSCINCKYSKESADGEHCSNCSHNAVDNFEKMTNADHIRSMTDEELSIFLCTISSCSSCIAADFCRNGNNGMIEWLQSPVEV